MDQKQLTTHKGTENEGAANPLMLIERAINQNLDIEKMERLLAMQERWEATQSRKAFFTSLGDFQAICPVISKNKKVDYSAGAGKVNYNYATLDGIIAQIKEPLHRCGLSYRFDFKDEGALISVTCHITHSMGHTESTTMTADADKSGSKNNIQSRGSTLTYLQRYTLIGALGIGTAQDDVDGRGSGYTPDDELDPSTMATIKEAKSLKELKELWDQNPELHKVNAFITAINKAKGGISGKAK